MEINQEIKEVFKAHHIEYSVGILYLMGVHFKLNTDIIPEVVKKQIAVSKIIERDYENNTVQWNMPLFNGQEIAWEWCKDWMSGFGKRNPDRRGDKTSVVARMKEFFSKNPEVRKEDIYAARDLYFKSVSDNQYLKSSHKFIYDGMGKTKSSMLQQYVDTVMKNKQVGPVNNNQVGEILN